MFLSRPNSSTTGIADIRLSMSTFRVLINGVFRLTCISNNITTVLLRDLRQSNHAAGTFTNVRKKIAIDPTVWSQRLIFRIALPVAWHHEASVAARLSYELLKCWRVSEDTGESRFPWKADRLLVHFCPIKVVMLECCAPVPYWDSQCTRYNMYADVCKLPLW